MDSSVSSCLYLLGAFFFASPFPSLSLSLFSSRCNNKERNIFSYLFSVFFQRGSSRSNDPRFFLRSFSVLTIFRPLYDYAVYRYPEGNLTRSKQDSISFEQQQSKFLFSLSLSFFLSLSLFLCLCLFLSCCSRVAASSREKTKLTSNRVVHVSFNEYHFLTFFEFKQDR